MFQVFQMFQTSVSSVSSRCCICCYGYTCMFQACVSNASDVFRLILQMFHLDIVKVDLDIAYVAMAIHTCFKTMFQVFHMFSDVCCKCFIWMLQVYVPNVLSVSDICCNCFI